MAKSINFPTLNHSFDYLIKKGFRMWNEPDKDGNVLLLIPGNLYHIIPNGTVLTGISGEKFKFKRGESDDDTRFGCLPYGVIKKYPK